MTARPMIPCPMCSTEQPFPPRTRSTGKASYIEVYISCTACPYESVSRVSTAELEILRKTLARVNAAAHSQAVRYGQPFQVTRNQLEKLTNRIREQQMRIDRDLQVD